MNCNENPKFFGFEIKNYNPLDTTFCVRAKANTTHVRNRCEWRNLSNVRD